jgi:hypothetical protein
MEFFLKKNSWYSVGNGRVKMIQGILKNEMRVGVGGRSMF